MTTTATQQQTSVYSLDRAHTTIEFVVRHLMITKVRGRFTNFDGRIEVAPGSDLLKRSRRESRRLH